MRGVRLFVLRMPFTLSIIYCDMLHASVLTPVYDAAACYLQTDRWHQRRMPDPRLVMDAEDQLPCQVAARRHHPQLARMLLPSTPMSSAVESVEGVVLGPPSLANIAAAILRDNLHHELVQVQHQLGLPVEENQQEPEQHPIVQDAAEEAIFDIELHPDDVEQQVQLEAQCEAEPAAVTGPAAVTEANLDLEHVELLEHLAAASLDAAECSSTASGPSLTCSLVSRSSSTDSSALCGVCFDQPAHVTLAPCVHKLCVTCCKQLLALNSKCVLMCPFCRANVAHVGAAHGIGV
eukprot:GHUV01004718.1.p1 GENE.GHUV01004718.1~~GHUV01004718.1.p1  ORF type:complete len:292 (+),score=101.94 GHUV01004718.1:1255-2130(+)